MYRFSILKLIVASKLLISIPLSLGIGMVIYAASTYPTAIGNEVISIEESRPLQNVAGVRSMSVYEDRNIPDRQAINDPAAVLFQ